VWICRLQALALLGLAVVVVVLSTRSHSSLAPAFVISEVVGALLVAALFASAGRHRLVRTPILLVEIIAALISAQLVLDHRAPIAVAVGVPALVATVLILAAARDEG
jgi:hypothetical protein